MTIDEMRVFKNVFFLIVSQYKKGTDKGNNPGTPLLKVARNTKKPESNNNPGLILLDSAALKEDNTADKQNKPIVFSIILYE
jgi:hypothetical protein